MTSQRIKDQIDNNFVYHRPFGDQPARYESVRNEAKKFAEFVAANTPESREQAVALTNIEQAVFWANASIARNEKEPEYETKAA